MEKWNFRKKKSLEELNRTIILFGEAATVSMGV
jgi:hypothetical protein